MTLGRWADNPTIPSRPFQQVPRSLQHHLDRNRRHTGMGRDGPRRKVKLIARTAGPPGEDHPVARSVAVRPEAARISRPEQVERGRANRDREMERPAVRTERERTPLEDCRKRANRRHPGQADRGRSNAPDNLMDSRSFAGSADDHRDGTGRVGQTPPDLGQAIERPAFDRRARADLNRDEAGMIGKRTEQLPRPFTVAVRDGELECVGRVRSRAYQALDQTDVLIDSMEPVGDRERPAQEGTSQRDIVADLLWYAGQTHGERTPPEVRTELESNINPLSPEPAGKPEQGQVGSDQRAAGPPVEPGEIPANEAIQVGIRLEYRESPQTDQPEDPGVRDGAAEPAESWREEQKISQVVRPHDQDRPRAAVPAPWGTKELTKEMQGQAASIVARLDQADHDGTPAAWRSGAISCQTRSTVIDGMQRTFAHGATRPSTKHGLHQSPAVTATAFRPRGP